VAAHGIGLPKTGLFIGGRWCPPRDDGTIDIVAPASEEVIATVAAASAADIDIAVRAARNAFDNGPWPSMQGSERRDALLRLASLIERDAELIGQLEALDVGKPVTDARFVDLPNTIETYRHFAGWADRLHGLTFPAVGHMGRHRAISTFREPVGVIAAITPWNAPTMIAAWKLAPALAAGCTVVLKPPEDAPLTSLHLAGLVEEADLPAGVVNIVPGTGAIAGAALVLHPGIDKISFTGSVSVGREIAAVAARSLRPVTLELGGKSPQIIFEDAPLRDVLPVAALSFLAGAGQVCAAGSRLLVHEALVDDVVDGLKEIIGATILGDPFDEATTMGPLVSESQRSRVLGYIDAGREEGAELEIGGTRPDRPGYFVAPTLFKGNNSMRIAQEEIFGPVGIVIPFSTDDEAIEQANDTAYGLNAVVWTASIERAYYVSHKLRSGTVWINGWGPPDPRAPWGGVGDSGLGRELGPSGIDAVTVERILNLVY